MRKSFGIRARTTQRTCARTIAGILSRASMAIIASCVVAVTAFAAQSTRQQTVAGTWTGTYGTPGGPRPLNLVLKVDGTKLSGSAKRETGDLAIVGHVKGDSVTFSYTITYNEHPLDMSFAARVTGDTMKGVVDFGGQGQDVFEAKRASAPAR